MKRSLLTVPIHKIQVLLLAVLLIGSSASAKNIYLSASGDDSNSGASASEPVLSMFKATELVEDGDVILVSGIIDMSIEANVTNGFVLPSKSFTIEGQQENSGFTGSKTNALLVIKSNTKKILFKDLVFMDGVGSMGSALSIQSSNASFENCLFTGNIGNTDNNKGTVYLNNPLDVSFKSCVFKGNTATEGGGLFIEGGSVILDKVLIEDNDLSTTPNSKGGGVYLLNCNSFILKNSTIRNCKTVEDGAAIYLAESDVVSNLRSAIKIESSLLAYNTSTSTGGAALSIYNETAGNNIHISLINSTIYGNGTDSQAYGGAISVNSSVEGSLFDMINCTVVGNKTGGNRGYGAGICFQAKASKNMKKNFFNCIIESNIAARNSTNSSDLIFRSRVQDDVDLSIKNSYIAYAVNNVSPYAARVVDKNEIGYQLEGLAGLALPHQDYIASQNSIPLAFDSDAIDQGNAKYLKDLNVSTDQLGNKRSYIGDMCAIGSVEVTAEPEYEGESRDYTHLIMYGQSLSTGHDAGTNLGATNVAGNFMIGDQVWINYGNSNFTELKPLVGHPSIHVPDIVEPAIIGTANHIQKKGLASAIIATSSGDSGRTIEELSKESEVLNLYDEYLKTLKSAYKISRRSNSTINCPAIFWLQGEWNYQGYGSGLTAGSKPTFNKDEYKALMIKLKDNMQSDAKNTYKQTDKPTFYTYQVGAQYTKGKELTIGMAQLEASNQYRDVICAGPVYAMTDYGGHLDANGYRWYGEMLGKVYYKNKVLGEDFKPLQPKTISRDTQNNKKIIIQFLVPKAPLALDVNTLAKVANYGFEVYSNNTRQTILDVKVVGDDSVEITCFNSLIGDIEVVYAGANTGGHGNLRDSDDFEAVFNYQNIDEKDEDGNYIYPRIGDKTLRPSYEPKDASGNIIYGKPYPLYNFSVAFYYKLPIGQEKLNVSFDYIPSGMAYSTSDANKINISESGKMLRIETPDQETQEVKIYDLSGKIISDFGKILNSASVVKEYSLSTLLPGIYIVSVATPRIIKTSTIILKPNY